MLASVPLGGLTAGVGINDCGVWDTGESLVRRGFGAVGDVVVPHHRISACVLHYAARIARATPLQVHGRHRLLACKGNLLQSRSARSHWLPFTLRIHTQPAY